jgi:hypothetical protein
MNALTMVPPHLSSELVPEEELDRRRLMKVLRERVRYRYVRPTLQPTADGWWITSPCCSRRVDPAGAMIDIAWLERMGSGWRIHYRDHAAECWVPYHSGRLSEVLDLLRRDPDHVFWP